MTVSSQCLLERKHQDPWEFRRIFEQLMHFGARVAPRGLPVIEQTNWTWRFSPMVRWMNFESRKLSIEYVKAELRWYLRGDRRVHEIAKHAKLWAEIADDKGEVNSNYGHYLFRQCQVAWVIDELKRDPDSRRASAVILQPSHLTQGNKDVPCTYGMNFRIRGGRLHASVHMRSQDAFFGLGNDLPFFSFVQELVAVMLEKPMGDLHMSVDSFHIYEKHWEAAKLIIASDVSGPTPSRWNPVDVPCIQDPEEARNLITLTPQDKPFSRWLYGDVLDERQTCEGLEP